MQNPFDVWQNNNEKKSNNGNEERGDESDPISLSDFLFTEIQIHKTMATQEITVLKKLSGLGIHHWYEIALITDEDLQSIRGIGKGEKFNLLIEKLTEQGLTEEIRKQLRDESEKLLKQYSKETIQDLLEEDSKSYKNELIKFVETELGNL